MVVNIKVRKNKPVENTFFRSLIGDLIQNNFF